MKKITVVLLGLFLVVSVAANARAVPISGELYLGGIALDATFDAATATVLPSMTGGAYATGDLSPLSSSLITLNSFAFNPASTPAANPLWESGNFTFILDTVGVTLQAGNQLGLTGFGTMTSLISGLDDTLYSWDLNITDGITHFSFSQSQGPVSAPVPEPATMLLLGTGLAGMAAIRRRKSGKA